MREVMVLMVQVVVVVLGKVVGMLHVRAAAVHVVHVHDMRLVVVRVAGEVGGLLEAVVGDATLGGGGVGGGVGVLQWVRQRVWRQGPG